MRETNERIVNTGIYARIHALPIGYADRENAIHALETAERIVGACVWISEGVGALRDLFLKPSLKH